MNYNSQELEAFAIEAELINQKVKALAEGNASPEQIDEIIRKKAEDKSRREEALKRRQRQALDRKVKGREGKGISKDFSNFCRHCHLQFELSTETCWKCNRPTMTLEQRQQQLKVMVEDYKYNKEQRAQKRHKWDMFQKSQAAMWKKSSINYNKKWDYFVEDSQQEPQKEPILPKNDPNFMAMEADLQARKKRRIKDNQNAKRIKDKGNAAMKQGDYQKAIQFYTLALQHVKDIKSIYTNRALAYIKRKKYQKAIKDCTNVIEYMEVFEKVGENKDLMFKALTRRALSKKELKDYKEALEDVNQALQLFPNDNQAQLLKKEVQSFLKHSEKVGQLIRQNRQTESKQITQDKQQDHEEKQKLDEKEKSKQIQRQIIEQLAQDQLAEQKKQQQIKQQSKPTQPKAVEQNPVKQIPKRLQNINQENTEYLLQLLIKNKDLRSIFIASKGIELTLDHIKKQQSSRNQVLLVYLCLSGDGVGEKRVWDWGVSNIYEQITSKFVDEGLLNLSSYAYVDNLLQILVPMSLNEFYRPKLASDKGTYQFIEDMFPRLITKYKKQPMLVDNFLTYFSNLCSGDSTLKNTYLTPQKFKVVLNALHHFILNHKSKNREFLDLRQTVYSLIANLITNAEHRKVLVAYWKKDENLNEIKTQLELYPRTAHNFDSYIENLLSVTANALFQSPIEAQHLAESIFERYVKNYGNFNDTIVYRALLTIGRIKHTDSTLLLKWMPTFDKMASQFDPLTSKYTPQAIKIITLLFIIPSSIQTVKDMPATLFKTIINLIKNNKEHELLFCNCCNLVGILVQNVRQGPLKEKVLVELRQCVGGLVEVAKERVGNWRKSAAILLGKISGDAVCRAELTKHHGMDVLKSIASFVLDKKA